MKQTAVEWLVEKLKSQGLLIGEPKNLVAVQQAKKMEKQRESNIIKSFEEWKEKYPLVNLEDTEWQVKKFFSEYYNPDNK